MKRKKRTRNDIAMAYRIDALPRRIRKVDFYKTLLDFLDGEIEELPEGWEVTWRWQNSKKQKWREEEFTSAVGNSRDSFMTLMRRRLQRDLEAIGGQPEPETDEEKLLIIEDILDEEFESLAEARKALRDSYKLSPAKRTPAKRKKRTRKAGKKRRATRKVSKVRKAKSRRGKARKRHNRA